MNRQQRRRHAGPGPSAVRTHPPGSLFIVGFLGVRCDADLGVGVPVGEHWVTNNRSIIRSLLAPELTATIGLLEAGALMDAGLVMYRQLPLHSGAPPSPAENEAELVPHLTVAREFILALWGVRDCAARFELGFLSVGGRVSARSWHAGDFSLATGARDPVAFTRAELTMTGDGLVGLALSPPVTALRKGTPRLARVLYLLQATRSMPDVGVKIAFYCTCMEALLAPPDGTELTYRLAERIALAASSVPSERAEAFALVREAYRARSRIIHGDVLSDRQLRDLPQLAAKIDALLRSLLRTVAARAELAAAIEADSLDEFFNREIFGTPPMPSDSDGTGGA